MHAAYSGSGKCDLYRLELARPLYFSCWHPNIKIEPSGEAATGLILILLWSTEKFADVGNPRLSIAYSFKRQRRETANYSGLNPLFDSFFPRWHLCQTIACWRE